MIFLITLGLMFGALVLTHGLIKVRKGNDVIEGAHYELERAREERAEISRGQLAGYHDGYSRRRVPDNGFPRF